MVLQSSNTSSHSSAAECPKFIPNIFNKAKCSQCFRTSTEHLYGGDEEKPVKKTVVKCGHLFIAPSEFSPGKNKRWQRRWFVLTDDGQLSYSIDEHPDAIPQGVINLLDIHEMVSAEEVTLHQYSFCLSPGDKAPASNTTSKVYLKGSNTDEYRSWMRVLNRFIKNPLLLQISPVTSPQREQHPLTVVELGLTPASPSCTSPPIRLEKQQTIIGDLKKFVPVKENIISTGLPPSGDGSVSNVTRIQIQSTVRHDSTQFVKQLRGDPDGCGGLLENSDGGRKGWLLLESAGSWTKYWFVLKNHHLISYKSPEEKDNHNTFELKPKTVITKYDARSYYPFRLESLADSGGETINLSAITNGMRCIWIQALQSAIPKDFYEKLSICKELFTESKSELEKLNREVVKNQKFQIENLMTKLNAGFLEIEKLEFEFIKKTNEESFRAKEYSDVLIGNSEIELRNELLREENQLLSVRLNDLTEKFYNSEKNCKIFKTRLQRYKSQSLKEKQIENDIYDKISDLEVKLNRLDYSCPPSTSASSVPSSPNNDKKGGLINVILKLNELDNRIDSEWYKCENCEVLNNEIKCRDFKLKELEDEVFRMESKLEYIESLKKKYESEINSLETMCRNGIQTLDNANSRLIVELQEKHKRQMQDLEIEHENALAVETRATRAALDALRKNHEVKFQKEMAKFREDFLTKYRRSDVDLEALYKQHEKEIGEIKEEILEMSEKYAAKCLECLELHAQLEINRNDDSRQ